MSARKIFIISPVEPSGVTWLINCFLELGIKTYRFDADNMWDCSGPHCFLKAKEEGLKKWLPVLYERSRFSFREDIEFEWAHDWPTHRYDGHEILYFIRDPRDSFFSAYKRALPNMSFAEFASFPHVSTLLSRIDNWCFYTLSWLTQPRTLFFRFEDYRKNDAGVLRNILEAYGLVYDEISIQKAAAASTHEKAAQAERRYVSENAEVAAKITARRLAMWAYKEEAGPEDISFIEDRSWDVLDKLGYAYGGNRKRVARDYRFCTEALAYFKTMRVDPSLLRPADDSRAGQAMIEEMLRFSEGAKEELLLRSGLSGHEMNILRQSLSEFARCHISKKNTHPAFFSRIKNFLAELR